MLTIDTNLAPDGCTVCRAAGELDAFTVPEFRQALAQVAPVRRLVIDLSAITFVDSSGLGALIGGVRRVRDLGGTTVVICLRPVLLSLFHTTGIDRIVTIVGTLSEAVADFDRSELAAVRQA